jgi:hypothetical protein
VLAQILGKTMKMENGKAGGDRHIKCFHLNK